MIKNERLFSFQKIITNIRTEDEVDLSATLIRPTKPKAAIIINGATAVPKEFYLPMASYFAEHNYACLLYDYRGVCSSQPVNGLKDCEYKLVDWGKQDLVAVISFMKSTFSNIPLYGFCHSVGGQLLGMAPNVNQFHGIVAFGVASGFWGNMPLAMKINSHLLFRVISPISHLVFGYTKLKFLGIMEDLPKNVTNKWRQWCSKPLYFFEKENAKEIENIERFKNLTFPIHIFTAEDDSIGTPKNVKNFWANYKSSKPIVHQLLKLSDYHITTLGHFGFFKRKHKDSLWPLALNKFEEYHK